MPSTISGRSPDRSRTWRWPSTPCRAGIPTIRSAPTGRPTRRYRAAVQRLFEEVDVILAPATPCTAPKLGQVMMKLGGVEMAVRANLGVYTQPISFIGLPVVVVPLQTPDGLPIGVQVIANHY